jgi:hypothetical protein
MVNAKQARIRLTVATVTLLQLAFAPAHADWRDPSPHRASLIERTDHYLFVLNEAQVLGEIRSFVQQLGNRR